MTREIKETCSCGAVLEYTETINYSYEGHDMYLQGRFHEAHKECRDKNLPPK